MAVMNSEPFFQIVFFTGSRKRANQFFHRNQNTVTFMMSDEEDDYMSDAFLNAIQDVKPGVNMVHRVKAAMKREEKHKELNIKNRQKSYKEQERESREAALQSSISNQNKGFALLQKMGYKEGQGLGKQGAGRVEPIPLNIKNDRGGIGMEEAKKRKAEEALEDYRQKVRAKQQNETKSLQDFRSRVRTEREEKKIEGDLRRSQRSCEQLDSQKGTTAPREEWYWPKTNLDDAEEEEEDEKKEEEETSELTSFDKLQILTSYLRGVHFYCIWCGTTYNDEEDLSSNCPGDTAADHE
ncbi:G patch domain-containing protein 11 [Synchiropus picturatus]